MLIGPGGRVSIRRWKPTLAIAVAALYASNPLCSSYIELEPSGGELGEFHIRLQILHRCYQSRYWESLQPGHG